MWQRRNPSVYPEMHTDGCYRDQTQIHADTQLLRYSDSQRYLCMLTHICTQTLRREALMAKQMLRKYLDRQTDIYSYRHALGQTHAWIRAHARSIYRQAFPFPHCLQVSEAEPTWNHVTVICCRELSQTHIIQTQAHINMFTSFTKMPL